MQGKMEGFRYILHFCRLPIVDCRLPTVDCGLILQELFKN